MNYLSNLKKEIFILKRIGVSLLLALSSIMINRTDSKKYITRKYKKKLHRNLNWENPVLFTEKIQKKKLEDDVSSLTNYSDKLLARDIASLIVSTNHIIPLIGSTTSFEAIRRMTTEKKNRMVIKCNHDSNSAYILDKPSRIEMKLLSILYSILLKSDYSVFSRERNYSGIEKKIILEEYIDNIDYDVKFFCFHGKVRLVQIDGNKNRQLFLLEEISMRDMADMYPNLLFDILDEMMNYAEKLSKEFPFVRIDFMTAGTNYWFTEYTFYPAGGFYDYGEKLDRLLGSYL